MADRTHGITTADGATIGGTVHGQGPPLVFVHGIIGDGDVDWQPVVAHLTARFTCYLPSTRGRGLSGDHPDHRRDRLIADLVDYVESLGEPVGLVGFSSGGALALAVASRSEAIRGVAVQEPAFPDLLDDAQREVFGATLARIGEHAAGGDLVAGSRTFAELVTHPDELDHLEQVGYLEAAGRYAPVLLEDIQQSASSEGPTPADPAVLGAISVPVQVLSGPDTGNPWFATCVRHAANHLPIAQVREIPGAGHYAPLTHPRALAEALEEAFVPLLQGA